MSVPQWMRLLDRELVVSAFCHDARGPLTAIDGFAELEGLTPSSQVRVATGRLVQMLAALPERPVADCVEDLADWFAVPSTRVHTAGLGLLASALGELAHGPVLLDADGDHLVELRVSELDTAEFTVDWNLNVIRRWEAGELAGRAGARVRIAARLAAATRVRLVSGPNMARGVLGIAFKRALG